MEENKNEILISVPLELFRVLVSRSEQIAVIERLASIKKCIAPNDLMAIIAAEPIDRNRTDGDPKLSFAEMFKDTPGLERVPCDR